MTAAPLTAPSRPGRPPRTGGRAGAVALLVGLFAAAVALRVAVGAADPARVGAAGSVPAGLAFAAVLAAAAAADREGGSWRPGRPGWRELALALAGLAVLCLPVLLRGLPDGVGAHRPGGSFAGWAAVVAVVAVAEEAFLRGALYRRVAALAGPAAAVAGTAVCFAGLHLPLYGWASVPLDLAVGLWLGWLRYASGGWSVPAAVHAGADLAGWWLR